ncbi:hypothetical protein Y032_0015g2620 [Ancylostoma ceylanicum]|uniref:G-protein coupled receptors family 1 profile domain-containing protein n=1 Tax=Ancylostoma ceylanicum TaxID=53326 RepID=A0A016V8N8_9BILA|nr:hypothetical protein Y032_0015g2620 [Ancylostoma ceylanicum]
MFATKFSVGAAFKYTPGRPDSVVVPSLAPPRSRSAPPHQHGFIAAPSAVVLFLMSIWDDRPFRSPGQWYNLQVITSFLVIVGKCLNFVVFCLSSENFRQKLLATLRARCGGISEEKRCHSVITTYTRCDSRDSRILSAKKSFQSI